MELHHIKYIVLAIVAIAVLAVIAVIILAASGFSNYLKNRNFRKKIYTSLPSEDIYLKVAVLKKKSTGITFTRVIQLFIGKEKNIVVAIKNPKGVYPYSTINRTVPVKSLYLHSTIQHLL